MTSFQTSQLGKYIILDRLAMGGMAELFRAMINSVQGFEKLVAIKKILPHLANEEDLVSSFIEEAKLAAPLHHQNIVQIYDFGNLEDTYFIAMEYLQGKDCKIINNKAKEKNSPLGRQNALFIVSRICAGLDYAHKLKDFQGRALNIIHRDISPQNIIVTYEGEVKIVDFGIAKAATQNTQTQMGMIKGKVAYMSPEQATGKTIDHRSNIFSCGILLYELITGERMFSGDTMHILSKIRDAEYVIPEELQRELPEKLIGIFELALQKEPEKRYQTCGDMLNDLEECMQLGTHPSPQGLSKYMKTLFADEIVAEEQHLQKITKIGLMQGGRSGSTASAPEIKKTELQEEAPPPEPGRKNTKQDVAATTTTNITKYHILAALFLVLLAGIALFTLNRPKEIEPVAPQIAEAPLPAPEAGEPVEPVEPQEAPGTETYSKAMDALIEKRFDEAVSLFEDVLAISPEMKEQIAAPYGEALAGLANSLAATDSERAIHLFEKAIQLDPANELAHFQLGLLFMNQEDYAAAVQSYENVIELNPDSPDTFFNLGFIYALTKDYARAEEMYARVVALEPSYLDEALFNLALVQSKLDKTQESIVNLEIAIHVNPNNELARNFLKKLQGASKE